jgi:peptidylprolyl isomerase
VSLILQSHPLLLISDDATLLSSAGKQSLTISDHKEVYKEKKMTTANRHDTVKIFYEGKLKHGKTFNLFENDRLEFTIGEGNVLPGLERAVVGMAPGEEKTVEIPAKDAYGPHRKGLVEKVDIDKWPKNSPQPSVGMRVFMEQPDDRQIPGYVINTSESDVTIDTNHPLAGRDLIFRVQLLDLEKNPGKAKR